MCRATATAPQSSVSLSYSLPSLYVVLVLDSQSAFVLTTQMTFLRSPGQHQVVFSSQVNWFLSSSQAQYYASIDRGYGWSGMDICSRRLFLRFRPFASITVVSKRCKGKTSTLSTLELCIKYLVKYCVVVLLLLGPSRTIASCTQWKFSNHDGNICLRRA